MHAPLILLAGLALAGCNMADAREGEEAVASGSGTKRSFDVAAFDSVSLGGQHNVIVSVGPAPSVRAEGDPKALDRLEIKVRDGDLHIGQKDDRNFSLRLRRDRPALTVYVTAPALKAAAIGGSGDMTIDKVEGKSFDAAIGGSGNLQVGTLQVEQASFSIGGSGSMRAAGSAGEADISIAGSGDVDLTALEARSADISVAGSGNVRLRATESADVSVVGSGDVAVDGPAKCSVSKMGSGDVRCGA